MYQPRDWTESKIGEYCLVGDGAHAKIPRQESGVMYLTSKNFKPEGLDLSKVEFISTDNFEKHFRKGSKAVTKPEPSDVLVSIIGSLGEPYVVRPSDRFGLSSSVAIIRPRLDRLVPKYLYYWMKGETFQSAVYGTKGGVAQSYLSLEMIRSLPLRFPSLSVQGGIVKLLSAYDDLIENNNRRIKKLEEITQMVYREWFVKLRFPGHEKVNMEEKESGVLPLGWTVTTLVEVLAELESGSRPHGGAEECKDGVPSVGAENICGLGRYDYSKERFVNREFYEQMRRGRIRQGDVLLYKDGANIGRKSLFRDAFPHLECAVNEHVFILRCNNRVSQSYLYFWLDQPNVTQEIKNLNANAAQPGINQAGVRGLPIMVPDSETLKRFDQLANWFLGLLFNLSKRNKILKETRDLLLPKLISGGLSLTNLTTEVATPA